MRGDIAPEECIETLRLYEKKWDLQHVAPGLEIYPVDLVTAETYTFTHRCPKRFGHVENLPDDEEHRRE
jgi:hypothetical protein